MSRRPRSRRLRSAAAVTITGSLVAGIGFLAAPSARAVALPPPVSPHVIFVQTQVDAVEITNDPATAITVNVLRNGVQIGTSSGVTDAAGNYNLNTVGGPCFTGSTPLILNGDVVQVITAAGGEQTTTVGLTGGTPVDAGGVIQIHGTAMDVTGAPLPVGLIQARITNANRFSNGKRVLLAGNGGANGTLTYDTPGGTAFTASFPGLTAADFAMALTSAVRIDYRATVADGTIYNVGGVPAVAAQCAFTAPLASYGVTAADHTGINAGNIGLPVTLSGAATDATAVTATLTDSANNVASVIATVTPAAGPQTWMATFSAAQLAGLVDGPITAAGSYTTANGVVTGTTLTLQKKLTLPVAPTMSPVAGVYTKAQVVSLSNPDPAAVIHFTTDGTAATAASPIYSAPFNAPMGTTTVRAVAVDVAGNVGPESNGNIVVTPPAAGYGAAVSPTSVNLGSAPAGTHSSPGYVTLKNIGTAPLTVSASVGGSDHDEFSVDLGSCGTLAVGAMCTPAISFHPVRAGNAQAEVVLSTPAGDKKVAVTGTATAPPTGYWMLDRDGNVFNFGDAGFDGGLGGVPLSAPVVAMAATPTNQGYWLTTADGLVFAFGDATVHGSMAGQTLSAPIVGMAATPSGNGYWLLGKDGGIFSFGDAQFFGSTGGMKLNQPILGLAATPTGGGYWLVASDGGIFAFGDAGFFGSTGSIRLNKPIVGMQPTSSGQGYWLVASDGGIFAYGDAGFFGSTGSIRLAKPITGMATTATGQGYWLMASDGGIFAYGDAPFLGSIAGTGNNHVIGGVSLHN